MQIDWFATNVIMKKILLALGLLICIWSRPLFADVNKDIDVQEVQILLAELCYNPGPIDGIWGRKLKMR